MTTLPPVGLPTMQPSSAIPARTASVVFAGEQKDNVAAYWAWLQEVQDKALARFNSEEPFFEFNNKPVTGPVLLQMVEDARKRRSILSKLLFSPVGASHVIQDPTYTGDFSLHVAAGKALTTLERAGLIDKGNNRVPGLHLTKAGKQKLKELKQQ